MRKPLKIALQVLGGLVLLLAATGGWLWWKLRARVEPIPVKLAEVAPAKQLAEIRLSSGGDGPDFTLASLAGHTSYLVVESKESLKAQEGKILDAALDRWIYPDPVRGVAIGEAEGLGFLRWKIDKFVKLMRKESRLPLYVDYDGVIPARFKLPRGHTGVIVLDPAGQVVWRHSGPFTDGAPELEELRAKLGADEPPAPPPAPTFAAGPLSLDKCHGTTCALLFLGARVDKKRVPGIKGGFVGSEDEDAELYGDPNVRLVSALWEDKPLPAGVRGVVLGDTDVELTGWLHVADKAVTSAARRAFGLSDGDAALVIVDPEGRLAFQAAGLVPFWRFSAVERLLGAR